MTIAEITRRARDLSLKRFSKKSGIVIALLDTSVYTRSLLAINCQFKNAPVAARYLTRIPKYQRHIWHLVEQAITNHSYRTHRHSAQLLQDLMTCHRAHNQINLLLIAVYIYCRTTDLSDYILVDR